MGKKVCKHGLNDIWINGADGSVRMCGWSNFFIGKLTENSIEDIWNGKLAEEFRKSMLDGSYRYCNPSKCPYCANNQLGDNLVDCEIPELPTMCSLSYQLECNYVCKFCRETRYIPCECEMEQYRMIENEVKKIVPHLKILSSNGAGEFFCSDSIINLLNTVQLPENIQINIETNGSLFNERNWNRIRKLENYDLNVSVTVHSFNENTYKYLSGTTLPVEQIRKNIEFISNLRKQGIIRRLEIATVVCERNFREMPEFVETCLSNYEMDTIRLRFFEPYGVMDLMTEWFYDVRNEYHPYYKEFIEVMKNPIFNHPKVWKWQGETKSLQLENPYVLEKRRGEALAKLLIDRNAEVKIANYIKYYQINNVALYGASIIGKAFCKELNNYGLNIEVIFDTYAQDNAYDDYAIMSPSKELVNKYDLIIITADTFERQIVETLQRMEYKGKVITMSCLLNSSEVTNYETQS